MQEEEPIPLEQLFAEGAVIRDGHGKATTIIRSSMAIVSIISSSVIIWMITRRTNSRLSTTYHRLLLGMSCSDILFSLGLATFNSVIPVDDDYLVWNAKGNQRTCNFDGFIIYLGAGAGLIYSCSLNVYYLAVVNYRKTDEQIRTKYEPFLHGVPIVYAVIISVTLLLKKNINSDGQGMCFVPVYDPLHCIGFEDGQTREGFTIPCGRGRDGAVIFSYIGFFATVLIVPLFIGVSLGMIYRIVRRQEKRMERYTVRQSSPAGSNREQKKSRAVLHRAAAFSLSYFLTWTSIIIRVGLRVAGIDWPMVLRYIASIISPLQGFYNLLIFMQPKVLRAKQDNTSWCQAFAAAFQGSGDSGKSSVDKSSGRESNSRDVDVQQSESKMPTKSPNPEEEKSSESFEENVVPKSPGEE